MTFIPDPADDLQEALRLALCGRSAEARGLVDRLAAAHPRHAGVVTMLGFLSRIEGQLTEAVGWYEQAAALDPNNPDCHLGLGMALLALGEFDRGWREFEWRLRVAGNPLRRPFSQPQWTGQELRGRTILLHAEGGHGDAIQFCRYLPEVARRGANVLLECQPALVPLLRGLPGAAAVQARGDALPPFDLHCPLQSLPHAFATTLDNLPAAIPYLSVLPEAVERWRKKLSPVAKFRVGLCWSGSNTALDPRSRTLATFAPLAAVGGVEFHGLQAGDAAHQWPPAGLHIHGHASELTDFLQTAALIENLDLVITVDTSIAHLAGALGRRVWVMIPWLVDFRWMLDRDDSPWYPTMRLFRQPRHATDFAQVACAIAVALRELVR